MEEGDTGKNRQLDVEYIQKKLDEGYKYTEEAKGRDLVLVIGNTGVGKSTTSNYLLGQRMKEGKFNGRPVIETIDETDIKIGHEVKAETLYAKTILVDCVTSLQSEASNSRICLLDCPGFLGNRTVEDRVIESISTELAIRNSRQIKGILILVSLNILQETRVTELRELVKTLISLFKDPVEMVQYSIFIITKKYKFMPDSEAREITTGALHSLRDHCQNQSKLLHENQSLSSSEGLTYIDFDRISTYFAAVLERHNDIIFINPLDNGESRQLVFDRINGIKPRKGYFKEMAKAGLALAKKAAGIETKQICPITIDDFSFSAYDENRVIFNKVMYDSAHDGHLLISKIRSSSEMSLNFYSEISSHQARLPILEQLLSNLGNEVRKTYEDRSQHLNADFESIKNFESVIRENEKQIKSIQNKVDQNVKSQENLNKELKTIDTTAPLKFVQKYIHKTVSRWKFFGWEEMKFNANTGDTSIPIIEVNIAKENGKWADEVDQRDIGIYKITYNSDYYANPAKASVTTYIQTKDEAGNKIRVGQINNEIAELSNNKDKLKSQIDDLKSINKTVQSTIEQSKSSKEAYKNSLKQKLKECENDIERHNCLIGKMQQDKEKARMVGISSLREFYKSQQKFDIVVSIAAVLEFPSSLINRFISEYKEFLSEIESYSHIFDESNINFDSLSHMKESEEVIDLKDPITGEEIKDPVLTAAGTLFDSHSLLKQFDTDKETILPFVFQREDGSIEEIKYFSWQKVPDIKSYLDNQRNKKLYSQSLQSSMSFFTTSEISQMTPDQLKEQKEGLLKEIHTMREQLEEKQTELDKICRQLEKL